MSNVLIGIIGVILFIGLALAGALFLGPRFQESTNNSKAAAIVQTLSQFSSASNMYQVNEGKPLLASNFLSNAQTLIDRGYLKSLPTNPVNSDQYITVDSNGGDQPVAIRVIFTNLGNGTAAKSVCSAIERMAGNTNIETSLQPTSFGQRTGSTGRYGCVNNQDYPGGMYQAYIPV